jgi:hypothetical protein
MRRVLSLLLGVGTTACGDGVTDPDGTLARNLAGNYVLVAYNASPVTAGLGGTLTLAVDRGVDSTYTLSVAAPGAWSNAAQGRWSWTGANVRLTTSQAVTIHGSILNGGVGFTAHGYPALFFRKQ